MKRFLILFATVILSLLITFITFENLSWYHFGDIPTKVVFIRLIIFFCVTECLIFGIFALIKNKLLKKDW